MWGWIASANYLVARGVVKITLPAIADMKIITTRIVGNEIEIYASLASEKYRDPMYQNECPSRAPSISGLPRDGGTEGAGESVRRTDQIYG